uniref:Uncharacterized protein n=1 Tax=Spironucleus salmonicida TaxID=348837 RepID=V6LR43_9EUKA|eukprot:EST46703.1 Hypothetical protein SS50377_13297 [Spironucleus salmonicida]
MLLQIPARYASAKKVQNRLVRISQLIPLPESTVSAEIVISVVGISRFRMSAFALLGTPNQETFVSQNQNSHGP